MSAKEPVIKFSPFEALFIGEKNKILKRQPMKNTIFVTRLNQRNKTINLRDLFGLEKNSNSESSNIIFKMPQRVCDFLKFRKLQNKKLLKNERGEILCYEFEGKKMVTKGSNKLMAEDNNLIAKHNKVRFKQRFKYKDNIRHNVVKKFPKPARRRNYFECKYKSLGVKNKNKNKNSQRNRHLLRGKDGKFICRKDYENLKTKEISPKQKYISHYLHQLYLKRNNQLFSNAQLKRNESFPEFEMPYSIKTVVGLPNLQFDIPASEAILNEVSKKYYESNCHDDFQFPVFPRELPPLNFENDSNLIDIIYENFPKIAKFESQCDSNDFSCALLNSEVLKPEKIVKMYEKKKNGFVKDEDITEILEERFPMIKLKRINEIMPNNYSAKNGRSAYATKIDEPYTKKNHLITGFGRFFFRSAEGKDIFIGSLIKPFLQNSWFGSLPES